MMTLHDHGTHMEMISVVQIATGLRNASGFAIHPTRGDLYLNDNGIDGLVDTNEPHSADELNSVPRLALGGTIEDFGFPDNYTAYRTGTVVGGAGVQPLIAFQPYTDPDTGLRSEGPNGVTFAPPGFPDGLNTGIFIGFHGKFVLGGLDNDENPVVYADPETGEYFHFILGQQAGIGHLDGLLATRDALYIADLSTGGGLFNNAGQGVIYKIRSLAPVPPELSVAHGQDSLILEWERGQLYHSGDLSNDWQLLDDAFSPLEFPKSQLPRFFRSEY
jgi:glucose/arabinose dehydrogenase